MSYLEAAVIHGKQTILAEFLSRWIASGSVGSVEPATVPRHPPSKNNFQTLPGRERVSGRTSPGRSNGPSRPPSPSLRTERIKWLMFTVFKTDDQTFTSRKDKAVEKRPTINPNPSHRGYYIKHLNPVPCAHIFRQPTSLESLTQ